MRLFKALIQRVRRPNRSLEEFMLELSRGSSDESLAAFYKELRAATLRVPADFQADKDLDGNRGMLAFTGEEAIQAWRGSAVRTVEMPVPELCAKALEAGMASVIINPCGPSGALIRQQAMWELVSGTTAAKKQAVPNDSDVAVSPPRVAPSTAAMSVFRAEAAKFPQIRAVYIVDAAVGTESARAMAALVLDGGTAPDTVIPRFIEESSSKVGKGKMMDVLSLDDTDPLAKRVREQGFEIYFRARK